MHVMLIKTPHPLLTVVSQSDKREAESYHQEARMRLYVPPGIVQSITNIKLDHWQVINTDQKKTLQCACKGGAILHALKYFNSYLPSLESDTGVEANVIKQTRVHERQSHV